jgi:Fe-S-cluster containining protein
MRGFVEAFRRLQLDDTFQFACQAGMACFNGCCRDLNQYLTPYDILRLKHGLHLSSQQFLDQYTQSHIGPRSGLPVVSLKMMEAENLNCPFVSPSGCTVYEDRPGSCRTYPLARMAARRPGQPGCQEFYVLIQEAHCLGLTQARQWTVTQWKKDQGLDIYNEMNDLMLDILSLKRWGKRNLTADEKDLFCLACYDLDKFRGLTFEKRLWEGAALSEDRVEAIREDDVALLRFAIEWIKGAVLGHGS